MNGKFPVIRAHGLDLEYSQSSGCLYLCDAQDGRALIGLGYSGKTGHVNRPESDHIVATGPIPRGVWRLDPPLASHPRLGPKVIPLEPADAQTAKGRSGFYVHGDNKRGDNSASRGCIIMPGSVRGLIIELYWQFALRSLVVTE